MRAALIVYIVLSLTACALLLLLAVLAIRNSKARERRPAPRHQQTRRP